MTENLKTLLVLLGTCALAVILFWLLPAPPAAAHEFECSKHGGTQRARCERHERMFQRCGAVKGEAHIACDREFLLGNPLDCSRLVAAEQGACNATRQAEERAFKS